MNYIKQYIEDAKQILETINVEQIQVMLNLLINLKETKGRLFILGVGGGAGHASHAVNDFRKICGLEAYTPTDNVSELTARVNDDGWDTAYVNWLKISNLNKDDMVLVFSVGGGNLDKNVSVFKNLYKKLNVVHIIYAKYSRIC